MKLIALNLPRDLSEEDLAALFRTHGEVKSCNLVMDAETGLSKGFGFIDMALADDAALAIKALHRTKLKKNRIRVKAAD